MKHKAKVDWWIGITFLLGLAVPILSVRNSELFVQVLAVMPWILIFGFCYPQSYETTADALVVRAGLTKRTIPYASISAIRPSSNKRSSQALSLDRVQIEYTSGDLLIAPDNQETFFADMASRAPQLTRRGQELSVVFH